MIKYKIIYNDLLVRLQLQEPNVMHTFFGEILDVTPLRDSGPAPAHEALSWPRNYK